MPKVLIPHGRAGRVRGSRKRRRICVNVWRIVPLSAVHWAIRVDLLTHARQEGACQPRSARFWHTFGTIIDFESDFVKLRYRITVDFANGAIVVSHTLCAFLETTADDCRLMIYFANDEDRANHTRCEALQHDSLIIVNGCPRISVRDGIGRRRGVVCVRWRWRCSIDSAS
jgi:hypothetical protein